MENQMKKNEIELNKKETNKRKLSPRNFNIMLILILVVLSILSLFIFSYWVSPFDVLKGDKEALKIMWHARIPRTVAVLVSGIGMSMCGLIMQSLTRNRFVSPTTAGTLDGARLGILASIILVPTASLFVRGIFAFSITMATTVLFIIILERIRLKNQIFVPLVGIIYGGVVSAIAMFFAQRTDNLHRITIALLGDFSLTLSGRYEIVLLTIPLLVVAYLYASKFMIAGLGQDMSKNLGLNYRLTVNIGLVIVSIITTLVLLTAGIIPFLGLVAPNVISLYMGDNVKKTLLPTTLFGGAFLLLCDIISRLIIFPMEVSASLTVGIVGAALFLVLLFARSKVQE